jgi:hypothetical protein
MTEFLPRGAWTDTPAGGATLTDAKLKGNACHYPASGNVTLAGLSREQVASRLRGWRDYHVNVKGWSDIGYQVAIDGAGRVWTLRGIGRVPAAHASPANPDANEEYGATLWVLGDNERPTAAAIQAYRDFRTLWLARWPDATDVRGHRQVPGAQTECPGDQIIALIADGTLTRATDPTPPLEDDMTPEQEKQLAEAHSRATFAYDHVREGGGTNGRLDTLEARVGPTTDAHAQYAYKAVTEGGVVDARLDAVQQALADLTSDPDAPVEARLAAVEAVLTKLKEALS